MKNKTKQVFLFKCRTSTGEVVTHGSTNNRMLINIWYMLNKKVNDGRFYFIEDENGKTYTTCPCPIKFTARQVSTYLKSLEAIQDDNK